VDQPKAGQRSSAPVPSERRDDGISWLVLERGPLSGGWFLFMHEERGAPSRWDGWYLTKEEALSEAARQWGVAGCDWSPDP